MNFNSDSVNKIQLCSDSVNKIQLCYYNNNFCGGYYRVDDINYLCHVRYGMFPRNKSLALGRCAPSGLVIYCGNIPNGRDITNTYTATLTHIQKCNIVQYYVSSPSQLLTFLCYAKLCDGAANVDASSVAGEFCHHEVL